MPQPGLLRTAAMCGALIIVTLAVYSGALSNSFVNYDDDVYVTANPHVVGGLSVTNAMWAVRSTYAANWHPMTWLSHMLDVDAFGLDASKHHLTSLLLHAANVVLLFLLLFRLTGAYWRSALAAGLFALHPLHVESVAWIAERKDVLSTLFWLLTTWAWLRWLASRTVGRYTAVLVLFALGLMAKPMLVTLPFTLMLLDYWPLRRTTRLPLWKEKLPLFAMSAISSIITLIAQSRGATVQAVSALPLTIRVANVTIAYVWYLGKMFWPTPLACFYPYPEDVHLLPVIGSAILLLAVTTLVLRLARRAPYLAVGWAWYLGTLLPVIGLVQVGTQATADRYSYIPLIGVFIALAWGLAAVVEERAGLRVAIVAIAVASLVALIPMTRAQVSVWRDNVSLFEHAAVVIPRNYVAHSNLGLALLGGGKPEDAIHHFEEALRFKPDYVDASINLGVVLHGLGRDKEAVDRLRQALVTSPDSAKVRLNLGNSLAATGAVNEAVEEYSHALRLQPDLSEADQNLGLLLEHLGRHAEAEPHLERLLRLRPNDAAAHFSQATVLAGTGRTDEALRELDTALRLNPAFPEAYNQQGIILAGAGRNAEALERYEQALRLKPDYAAAVNNAGLALAGLNRIPEAVDRFQHAVQLEPNFAQAHYNLGIALARVNRVPEAMDQFERALRIDPSFSQAQVNLRILRKARN